MLQFKLSSTFSIPWFFYLEPACVAHYIWNLFWSIWGICNFCPWWRPREIKRFTSHRRCCNDLQATLPASNWCHFLLQELKLINKTEEKDLNNYKRVRTDSICDLELWQKLNINRNYTYFLKGYSPFHSRVPQPSGLWAINYHRLCQLCVIYWS